MAKPVELLPLLRENRRLNDALLAAGLPDARTLGKLMRQAADGDGDAAQWLDDRYPAWREMRGAPVLGASCE